MSGPFPGDPSSGDDTALAPGLRERKRLAAMRRIQEVSLDLFERDGFGGVTIERIAAEAEVSPSTVYRYFGTKEQIVLWDETDPLWLRRLSEEIQTKPPLEALRLAVEILVVGPLLTDEESVRRRVRLIMEEPSVEAASALALYQAAETIGNILSEALGREHGDLDIQLLSHALAGAVTGGIHHWYESDFASSFSTVLERVLDVLDHGFDLSR